VKFYDFIDKSPALPKVVIVEGVERLLAERSLATIVERSMPPAERDLNVERFVASELDSFGRVEAAVAALPFLGSMRIVIVRGAHELRADPRRSLLAAASTVPEGNMLVIEDLVSPASKRPEPLAKLFGRGALRIDTTPTDETRERFVRETLSELGASATPPALEALVSGEGDLAALRTDVEKLVLAGARIELADVERETLAAVNVKAYHFAGAVLEGNARVALEISGELFGADPRGAAIPLLSALATEYGLVWELARPGGTLPARARWRERELRAIARRLGARRARLGYERAVRGFGAIVTGRADDPRLVVELAASADAAARPPSQKD
jgi:DNA polymerase III delta subunit